MVRAPRAIAFSLALAIGSDADAKAPMVLPPPPPPHIQLNVPAPVLLPEETYGDWFVANISTSFSIASTKNDAGSVLGSICGADGCFVFFNPKIRCTEDQQYPALINAPAAAYNVVMTCKKFGDLLIYTMPLEGAITDAMSVGGVLGVAFPMASGEFKVSRFSLTGAARATARASQEVNPAQNPRKNVRDEHTL